MMERCVKELRSNKPLLIITGQSKEKNKTYKQKTHTQKKRKHERWLLWLPMTDNKNTRAHWFGWVTCFCQFLPRWMRWQWWRDRAQGRREQKQSTTCLGNPGPWHSQPISGFYLCGLLSLPIGCIVTSKWSNELIDMLGPWLGGEQWRITMHNHILFLEDKRNHRNPTRPTILQVWQPDPTIITGWLWHVTLIMDHARALLNLCCASCLSALTSSTLLFTIPKQSQL